jgi:hypothetical protein
MIPHGHPRDLDSDDGHSDVRQCRHAGQMA